MVAILDSMAITASDPPENRRDRRPNSQPATAAYTAIRVTIPLIKGESRTLPGSPAVLTPRSTPCSGSSPASNRAMNTRVNKPTPLRPRRSSRVMGWGVSRVPLAAPKRGRMTFSVTRVPTTATSRVDARIK